MIGPHPSMIPPPIEGYTWLNNCNSKDIEGSLDYVVKQFNLDPLDIITVPFKGMTAFYGKGDHTKKVEKLFSNLNRVIETLLLIDLINEMMGEQ